MTSSRSMIRLHLSLTAHFSASCVLVGSSLDKKLRALRRNLPLTVVCSTASVSRQGWKPYSFLSLLAGSARATKSLQFHTLSRQQHLRSLRRVLHRCLSILTQRLIRCVSISLKRQFLKGRVPSCPFISTATARTWMPFSKLLRGTILT